MLEDPGFKSWQEQQSYVFSKISSPVSAPTQPTTQYKQELFLWNESGQGVKSLHSHSSSAKFKIQWSHTPIHPVCLHGTYWDKFILPLPPTYLPLPNGHILSCLIKETFYTLLISYMHTS
jgi:hypothetical protein